MSTALTQPPKMNDAIEAALMNGDLAKLDTPGRLQYYKAVCESLGLNALTRPFEYIVLNGKLTLYARRDCAEQLRKIHGVAITQMNPQQIGDLFVVTVTAMDKTGRSDSSTGAVTIKGLTGEALANALMKAETKAKRRVTLSLCGLGLLDETEVEGQTFARQPDPEPAKELPKLTLTQELEASIKAQTFRVDGSLVKAEVLDVVSKTSKKGTAYLLVTIDGAVEGSDAFFCYHKSLFDAVVFSKGKVMQFEYEKKDQWASITNVLDVGGQEYRDGQPYNEPIDDSAVPF